MPANGVATPPPAGGSAQATDSNSLSHTTNDATAGGGKVTQRQMLFEGSKQSVVENHGFGFGAMRVTDDILEKCIAKALHAQLTLENPSKTRGRGLGKPHRWHLVTVSPYLGLISCTRQVPPAFKTFSGLKWDVV